MLAKVHIISCAVVKIIINYKAQEPGNAGHVESSTEYLSRRC